MATSKREKIIVGLAFLALLFIGIQYLFSGSGDDKTKSDSEKDSTYGLVMEVAQSIAKNNLTTVEQTILEKAQIPWPDQPFIVSKASSGETSRSAGSIIPVVKSDDYSFTGYLEIGSKRLAIINGQEYEAGERMVESKATVQSISSEQVLLMDSEGRMFKIPRADLTDMTRGADQ